MPELTNHEYQEKSIESERKYQSELLEVAKVAALLVRIEVVFTRLYGDPDLPGMIGDIPKILEALKLQNGRLDKVEECLVKHSDTIEQYGNKWDILQKIGVGIIIGAALAVIGVLIQSNL